MTTEVMKLAEAIRRAEERCKEILENDGYLTERDALLILYDELQIDPPVYLPPGMETFYDWLTKTVKSIDERYASSKDEV